MSSVELIGKLMAGAVNVHSTRGSAGFVLSKSELAGCLSGLSDAEMNLAIAKYGCGDLEKGRLLVHVQAYVTELALKEGWKPRNRELMANIAIMAVNEVIGENICQHCHGVGLVNKIYVCKVCDGTRHKALSGRAMAKVLNISNTLWLRDWKNRYDRVFDYVQGLDANIQQRLRHAN